jgi:hypothetical protein
MHKKLTKKKFERSESDLSDKLKLHTQQVTISINNKSEKGSSIT